MFRYTLDKPVFSVTAKAISPHAERPMTAFDLTFSYVGGLMVVRPSSLSYPKPPEPNYPKRRTRRIALEVTKFSGQAGFFYRRLRINPDKLVEERDKNAPVGGLTGAQLEEKKWRDRINQMQLVLPVGTPIYALHRQQAGVFSPYAVVLERGEEELLKAVRQHYRAQLFRLFEKLTWLDNVSVTMEATFSNLQNGSVEIWPANRHIEAYDPNEEKTPPQ